MYNVSVKWKSGEVTHDIFNDPYMIGKYYTKDEIRDFYKGNPNVDYINMTFESVCRRKRI